MTVVGISIYHLMLNPRQESILSAVIEEYVRTAQPVASRLLVEKYELDVSPATVRNDMAHLEGEGYLRQPHTSSGRIPTEEGYRYFLERFVQRKTRPRINVKLVAIAGGARDEAARIQSVAKSISSMTGETTFLSLEDGWNRRYGISHLLGKPEFNSVEMLREVSTIIDELDDTLKGMMPRMDQDVNVWIGGENPFGKKMSTIVVKYKTKNNVTGMMGIVGPLRMDYARNIKLLAQAKHVLEQH
jgi:transcriptional regulator of heat shock response